MRLQRWMQVELQIYGTPLNFLPEIKKERERDTKIDVPEHVSVKCSLSLSLKLHIDWKEVYGKLCLYAQEKLPKSILYTASNLFLTWKFPTILRPTPERRPRTRKAVLALGYGVSEWVTDQYVSTCLYLRYTMVRTETIFNSTYQ